MKKLALLIFGLGLALALATPANARVFVTAGFGYPAYGYYPYPAYPAYYAPPPVVYAPAYPAYYAPPPPVVYAPAPVTYAAPPVPVAATPTLGANPASETFIDSQGRTCRQFQTTSGVGPAGGTACLMPDGSWRAVQ